MPPKQNNHTIQEFFQNGAKRQKKQQKEKHKQFIKCPLVGSVGPQLKRVLQQYRQEIMREFNYGELAKQISQLTHFSHIGGILNSVLYLNITRTSDSWSEIYTPDHVDDVKQLLKQLISSINAQQLKNWLRNSFSVLKNENDDDSESFEAHSSTQNYQLLNIYGASGKMSSIVAIARTYNIEVLYTFDYTMKQEFEEMFASQYIQFTKNDQDSRRKIIVHRGQLPKFINQKMLQIQRVPFIWITDTNQNHELFDQFELVQYKHDELLKFIYVILLIEQNYKDQLDLINEEFKSKVIYENIKDKAEFYSAFSLRKPKITIKNIQLTLSQSEMYILILQMNGNMRSVLNWLQFYSNDRNVHDYITNMQLSGKQLDYMIQNNLSLFSCEMDERGKEWFDEQKIHLVDNIIKSRKDLLITNFKIKSYNPRFDYYLVNHTLKVLAINNPTTKTRRLNREPTDVYKPLCQFFKDEEEFERFKQFDKAELLIQN